MVCRPFVAGPNSSFRGVANAFRWLACGAIAGLFAWIVTLYYVPGKGYTFLIDFGALNHAKFLPEVKAVNHFELPNSFGYDAQWYAQIAVHPNLADPALNAAVDVLPYRARRILFTWTAWLIGGGDPIRVLNVYALQNVACWFILAALLMRWLPPVSWGNCLRWAAILFSFGLIFSVKSALLDGPSLLMVSIGMALIESGRPWSGALVMGISGMGKESNVLCGSALKPPDSLNSRKCIVWLARIALILLPVTLWILYLRMFLVRGDNLGSHNFSGPFIGLYDKLIDTFSSLVAEGYPFASDTKLDFLVLVGLLSQFLFFALRIRWRDPWWRLGASYAVLLVFLGDAIWENYPSAAARVLLPMTLAFNILVPRGRLWPILLLVGNLGVVGSADLLSLRPPDRLTNCFVVEGPSALRFNPTDSFNVAAFYGARNWSLPEKEKIPGRKAWDSWRWSTGDSSIAIHNPQTFPIVADVSFGLATGDERGAIVSLKGNVIWHSLLMPAHDNEAFISGIILQPGDTVLWFRSDRPAVCPGSGDHRLLTFSVRNLKIILTGRR